MKYPPVVIQQVEIPNPQPVKPILVLRGEDLSVVCQHKLSVVLAAMLVKRLPERYQTRKENDK